MRDESVNGRAGRGEADVVSQENDADNTGSVAASEKGTAARATRASVRARNLARDLERAALEGRGEDGGLDLACICANAGVNGTEAADWVLSERGRESVRRARAVTCVRAGLLLEGARSEAVRRLAALATDSENAEVARRACADLLKVRLLDESAALSELERSMRLAGEVCGGERVWEEDDAAHENEE